MERGFIEIAVFHLQSFSVPSPLLRGGFLRFTVCNNPFLLVRKWAKFSFFLIATNSCFEPETTQAFISRFVSVIDCLKGFQSFSKSARIKELNSLEPFGCVVKSCPSWHAFSCNGERPLQSLVLASFLAVFGGQSPACFIGCVVCRSSSTINNTCERVYIPCRFLQHKNGGALFQFEFLLALAPLLLSLLAAHLFSLPLPALH